MLHIKARDGQSGAEGAVAILVIGTLDTKLAEISALAAEIQRQGGAPIVLDSSGRAPADTVPMSWPLVTRERVASAAGVSISDVDALSRGEAIDTVRVGVRVVGEQLHSTGEVQAALCIGGAAAYVAGPLFASLPVGFPKLIVSPLASGARVFEPYVGVRDVAVLHSVADIVGVNSLTKQIIRAAAGYIVGAARATAEVGSADERRPTIAVSMNGNTTEPLMRAKSMLEGRGYEFVGFHANGVGGRALEDFVATGRAVGVLDYTTTELGGHLFGGLMDGGPDRLRTAGKVGVPQVVVPGCLDFITCGRWAEAEAEFPGRVMFRHNPELTLVRLTSDEMAVLGRELARRLNTSSTPTTICVPLRGLSINDCEGGVFFDPVADGAMLEAIRSELVPPHKLMAVDAHVCSEGFVDVVVAELLAALPAIDAAGPSAESIASSLAAASPQ